MSLKLEASYFGEGAKEEFPMRPPIGMSYLDGNLMFAESGDLARLLIVKDNFKVVEKISQAGEGPDDLVFIEKPTLYNKKYFSIPSLEKYKIFDSQGNFFKETLTKQVSMEFHSAWLGDSTIVYTAVEGDAPINRFNINTGELDFFGSWSKIKGSKTKVRGMSTGDVFVSNSGNHFVLIRHSDPIVDLLDGEFNLVAQLDLSEYVDHIKETLSFYETKINKGDPSEDYYYLIGDAYQDGNLIFLSIFENYEVQESKKPLLRQNKIIEIEILESKKTLKFNAHFDLSDGGDYYNCITGDRNTLFAFNVRTYGIDVFNLP
ncbi:hypothetical protein [Belliella baltica]|uniref:hypothetical protein n=1 Tax=Belliella baltica TaxID=232259 RepID=UPI0003010A08|nr:hypothetical protein [Belliella baltica]